MPPSIFQTPDFLNQFLFPLEVRKIEIPLYFKHEKTHLKNVPAISSKLNSLICLRLPHLVCYTPDCADYSAFICLTQVAPRSKDIYGFLLKIMYKRIQKRKVRP